MPDRPVRLLLGNRLTKTTGGTTLTYVYDPNDPHQLNQIQLGGTTLTTFAYDANGNRTSQVDGALLTALAYDAEDRLVWASVTGQPEQTYTYDDQGRRIRKTVGGTTTEFL